LTRGSPKSPEHVSGHNLWILRALFLALFDDSGFVHCFVPIVVGKTNPCSLARLLFSLRRFVSSACVRASERAQVCAIKQLVAMAPLKAVAVLVGAAGVSGVVHFQQEGEGYGFSLLALVFFCFLSCLVVTNRFSVYSLFGGKVFKWPFFLWEMYISFGFFPGF